MSFSPLESWISDPLKVILDPRSALRILDLRSPPWYPGFQIRTENPRFLIHPQNSEAKFKEFERRLKFKPPLKYGWFHLKLYSMFQLWILDPPWVSWILDPPWESCILDLPWKSWILDPPWESCILDPLWESCILDPPWESCIFDPPWKSWILDPPWKSCILDPPWESCILDPPWESCILDSPQKFWII